MTGAGLRGRAFAKYLRAIVHGGRKPSDARRQNISAKRTWAFRADVVLAPVSMRTPFSVRSSCPQGTTVDENRLVASLPNHGPSHSHRGSPFDKVPPEPAEGLRGAAILMAAVAATISLDEAHARACALTSPPKCGISSSDILREYQPSVQGSACEALHYRSGLQ